MSFQAPKKKNCIFLSMTQNEWENFLNDLAISNGSTPIIMLQHALFGSLKGVLHIQAKLHNEL